MMKRIPVITLFMVLLLGYMLSASCLKKERTGLIENQFLEYTIPSLLLKPLSFEFKGLVSDMLLIKFMSFVGGKTEQLDGFGDEEWQSIQHTLGIITDLDPYYWDAYLFAQVFLTWDEKHYTAANEMLGKARKYLPDDYRIPYYMGLNYYKFANDPVNGANYLMEASKIPGSPFYLASLAARLSAYGSEHQRGIVFLSEMLKQTSDPNIAEQYKLRIQALKDMYLLEQAIRGYKDKYKRMPSDLSDLVETGLIDKVPADPYGGKYYITKNEKVDATSKLVKKGK